MNAFRSYVPVVSVAERLKPTGVVGKTRVVGKTGVVGKTVSVV